MAKRRGNRPGGVGSSAVPVSGLEFQRDECRRCAIDSVLVRLLSAWRAVLDRLAARALTSRS